MEFSGWQLFAAAAAGTAVAGAVFWLTARLALLVGRLPLARPPFAEDLLASAGDSERLQHRALGRDLSVLLAAMLAGLITGAICWLLLGSGSPPAVADWIWIVVLLASVAATIAAGYFAFRLIMARRNLEFTWAAKAAVGNILKRLNLAGNSVFHGVAVDSATIDHVVVGRKGVFALNVVARPLPNQSEGKPGAELKNGKLWLAGSVEARPVGEAARNMTLLSGALSKLAGHRVPVRSVLVVPGWHTVPNGEGNHLVLNERNLSMITSWNTPDAYLMDEDCVSIHAFLHKASRVTRLS